MTKGIDGGVPTELAAFRERRAVKRLSSACLIRHVAGNMPAREFLVHVTGRETAARHHFPRHLVKGEAYWWGRGLAGDSAVGRDLAAILDEELPALMSVRDAAAKLPALDVGGRLTGKSMTLQGVLHLIDAGVLYPLYGVPKRGWLFVDQVTALAAARNLRGGLRATPHRLRLAEEAEARWLELRNLFPDATRLVDLADRPAPLPDPDPLPIRDGSVYELRRDALAAGDKAGWFRLRRRGVEGAFVVTVDGQDLTLPGWGVLPWVLGRSDAHGPGGVLDIGYRDGLVFK